MNPLVSVIIPVYNVKPYLREALDSVINQTYKRIEIIIVDDGSTDGSGNICDEYTSDSRVRVVHQENRGLSGARNTGLDLFKGEYLCFLDSDDAYHSEFIEKMLDNAVSTQADMTVCKYTIQKTTEKLGTKMRNHMLSWPGLALGTYNREDALRSLVEGKINDSVWNKLYKGYLWNNVRFPEGHNYEDTDAMYLVMYACKKITILGEVLLFHRDRLGSITHNNSENNIRDWMLSSSHLEAFVLAQRGGIFDDELVDRYRQRSLIAYMDLFAKCYVDRELLKELREKIIEKGKAIKSWTGRTRVAYLMVYFMPLFFRYAYNIYYPCRQFVWKVTGR